MISAFAGMEGSGGMEINFHSLPANGDDSSAAKPKASHNLIVSSRHRVSNYVIGRDRGEE
jgi:hypothetical protein